LKPVEEKGGTLQDPGIRIDFLDRIPIAQDIIEELTNVFASKSFCIV
jgi:hypothetical protein